MTSDLVQYILFAVGLAALIKGADFLVDGSSSLAKRLKVSTLVIGLTIVAFGTSFPELIVNIFAALRGSTEVVFGNIIGSNIANILLVLGVVAIIKPIKVNSSTIWKEIPFALLSVIVLFIMSNTFLNTSSTNLVLNRVSGALLLCFFAVFLYYVVNSAINSKMKIEKGELEIQDFNKFKVISYILIGLVGLYFGGKWVVDGAILIAGKLGLSEFFISATVIALGTSLPELVTGVFAARKGEDDLAVGNAVGSNIFNIFWILGVTSLIAPVIIPSFIGIDIVVLFFITLMLFMMVFLDKSHTISRKQGIFFVLLYVAYIISLLMRG